MSACSKAACPWSLQPSLRRVRQKLAASPTQCPRAAWHMHCKASSSPQPQQQQAGKAGITRSWVYEPASTCCRTAPIIPPMARPSPLAAWMQGLPALSAVLLLGQLAPAAALAQPFFVNEPVADHVLEVWAGLVNSCSELLRLAPDSLIMSPTVTAGAPPVAAVSAVETLVTGAESAMESGINKAVGSTYEGYEVGSLLRPLLSFPGVWGTLAVSRAVRVAVRRRKDLIREEAEVAFRQQLMDAQELSQVANELHNAQLRRLAILCAVIVCELGILADALSAPNEQHNMAYVAVPEALLTVVAIEQLAMAFVDWKVPDPSYEDEAIQVAYQLRLTAANATLERLEAESAAMCRRMVAELMEVSRALQRAERGALCVHVEQDADEDMVGVMTWLLYKEHARSSNRLSRPGDVE